MDFCNNHFNDDLIGGKLLLNPRRRLSNRNYRGEKQKLYYIEIGVIKPVEITSIIR